MFACFAQTRTLNQVLFDRWGEVHGATPDGVLWLAASNGPAVKNLRREALARGIEAGRLFIAPRVMDQVGYLARYAQADIAVDTYPYGSHITALNILWAGCPLLALSGQSTASRSCGSILAAAGLADLV